MSQELKILANAAAAEQGGPPVNEPPANEPPVATHHQQVASRVLSVVMTAKEEVSPLEKRDPAAVPFVRANSAVDVTFILGVVGLVENNPQLQGLTVTLDIAAAKETIDYIQAYVPVINELENFLKALKYSVAARKAEVGAQTLRTYQAMKGLARDKKLDLSTHTAILKRSLGRGRPSKRTKPPAPQIEAQTDGGKEEAKV